MSLPELTRRGALGLVLAGLATSGCDLTTAGHPPAETEPGPTPSSPGSTAVDPDTALVDSVRGELSTALALATAVMGARPALAAQVAPFRRLHRRHLAELPGESGQPHRSQVAGGEERVGTRVRRQEQRLQRALADSAVRSQSGPLAALLASMSAAVAQQLAVTEVSR